MDRACPDGCERDGSQGSSRPVAILERDLVTPPVPALAGPIRCEAGSVQHVGGHFEVWGSFPAVCIGVLTVVVYRIAAGIKWECKRAIVSVAGPQRVCVVDAVPGERWQIDLLCGVGAGSQPVQVVGVASDGQGDVVQGDILDHGQTATVAAATQLSAVSVRPSHGGVLHIKADPLNAPGSIVYVGRSSAVAAANGYPLGPGDELALRGYDVSRVWIIGSAAGLNCAWLVT